METLNSIFEVGNELASTMPLTQIAPVLLLVALAMIWGRYKEGLWIGGVAVLFITVTSNDGTLMEMINGDVIGPIAILFLGMTMALLALFTFVQQGNR